VKDVSDFVARGGDFRALMQSARSYQSLAEVKEDMQARAGQWLSTRFHERYIDENTPRLPSKTHDTVDREDISDELLRAKAYPCTKLLEFTKGKACCPFHNERTGSLQYYARTNSCYCFGSCGKHYDAIDLYRNKFGGTFPEAIEALNKMT
jgi:hypothetical protein